MSWFGLGNTKPKFDRQDWIKRHTEAAPLFTPDQWRLERYSNQRVFVYDEMMQNHPKEDLIQAHTSLQMVAYTKDKYTLWIKKAGIETIAFSLDVAFHTLPLAPIRGELHLLSSNQISKLDEYKLNGVQYIRQRMPIVVPQRLSSHPGYTDAVGITRNTTVMAWMYVGKRSFWYDQLDAGMHFAPVKAIESKRGAYYYFKTEEYGI